MEIIFSDIEIRDLCCSQRNLVRQFGAELAKKICCRLSMLAAAQSLGQISASPPISLRRVDGKGNFSVALGIDHQLLFSVTTPNAAQSGDFLSITEIQIIGPAPVPATKGKKQ